MSDRIRVRLDFVLVLDHDVEGIDDNWQRLPWATTVVAALDAGGTLGVVAIENSTRELGVVQPKKKRARPPRPRISEDIRMEPGAAELLATKMSSEFLHATAYAGQKR